MKALLLSFIILFFTAFSFSQSIDKFTGSYIKIDSSSSTKQGDVWVKNIDTTLLELKPDMTFSYKWAPMFHHGEERHIFTTGTWKLKGNKVILHSKYQQDEWRFFESYKPEYGDSLVKVFVQTYDSLIGFFQVQNIGVVSGTAQKANLIFKDKDYPSDACSATFPFKQADKIVFFGDFGRMPPVIPKDKKSNHFLLQYNLSTEWDYQYFDNFPIDIKNGKAVLGKKEERTVLLKQ